MAPLPVNREDQPGRERITGQRTVATGATLGEKLLETLV